MNERITRRTAMQHLAGMAAATGMATSTALSASASKAPAIRAAHAPAAIPASLQDGGTLRYLYNATPGPQEEVYLQVIDLFEENYPDVTVEKIRVPGELEIVQQMLAGLAAGDPADVFLNRQRTAIPFISRDALLDVAPLAERDSVDISDFWPSAIDTYGRGDALYAIPFGASSNAFYFNTERYEEAGVPLPTELAADTPWNWDTLLDQTINLTSGSGPGKMFGIDVIYEIDHVDMWIWQNDGELWDLEAKECYLAEAEARGAIQYLVDMVREHGVMPTPEQVSTGGDLFAAGRVGIKAAGRYVLNQTRESPFVNEGNVGMIAAPVGPVNDTTRGDDIAHSIPSLAKNQEAAWNFAALWATDEGQQIVLTTRRSYTSRRSFAQSDWMKENLLPWEDQQVYIEGLERTGVYQAPERANEVEAIFDREMSLAFIGEKTVDEATEAMAADIEVVLNTPL